MKMILNLRFVCFLTVFQSLSACSLIAPAEGQGVGSSGGGIGVECPGAPANNIWTLDLYEAYTVYRLQMEPSTGSFDRDVIKFGRRLLQYYGTDRDYSNEALLASFQKFMTEHFVDVPEGSLTLSQDATLPPIPSNCRFVQIALYDDIQDKVYIDRARFNRLSLTDQVALVFHEMMYKTAREFKARTSDDTRRMMGLLFSTTPPSPYWTPYRGKETLLCSAGYDGNGRNAANAYWLTWVEDRVDGVSGMRLFVSVVDGYFMLSRTSAFVPGLDLASVIAQGRTTGLGTRRVIAGQDFIDRTWTFDFEPLPMGDAMTNPGSDFFTIRLRSAVGFHSQPGVPTGAFLTSHCQKGYLSSAQ